MTFVLLQCDINSYCIVTLEKIQGKEKKQIESHYLQEVQVLSAFYAGISTNAFSGKNHGLQKNPTKLLGILLTTKKTGDTMIMKSQ